MLVIAKNLLGTADPSMAYHDASMPSAFKTPTKLLRISATPPPRGVAFICRTRFFCRSRARRMMLFLSFGDANESNFARFFLFCTRTCLSICIRYLLLAELPLCIVLSMMYAIKQEAFSTEKKDARRKNK